MHTLFHSAGLAGKCAPTHIIPMVEHGRSGSARDEIGAHVSSAGGPQNTPRRAAALDARVLQLFTKQPSRWAEPECTAEIVAAFAAERAAHGICFTAAHDSYLINLATSDAVLFARSFDSFCHELRRCETLGLNALVTHPGNATDGDVAGGLARNADAVRRALETVPGRTRVLFEVTAGSGSALGATFAQLATLIERVGTDFSERMGVCVDTCHMWAAGYDLASRYDAVFDEFDEIIGLERIELFHLNDSAGPLGSRRDRHAHIGAGALGDAPFRRLLNDERFANVPKVIETPKDDDALVADRRNLRRLRGYRARHTERAGRRAKRSESA